MRSVVSKFYVLTLVVRGSGEFPLDMLRYDRACPATEADAYAISGAPDAPLRSIYLTRFAPAVGVDDNSLARWKSFGWTLVRATHDDAPIYLDNSVMQEYR